MDNFRHWMTLCELRESIEHDFDGVLYHATAAQNLSSIRTNGIASGSYWATLTIVSYYAETVEDEGEQAIIIKAPLAAFKQSKLKPDQNGIDEPLTYTLGMSEEKVWEEWEQSKQTWRDSLNLIGSVKYHAIMTLPPAMVDE